MQCRHGVFGNWWGILLPQWLEAPLDVPGWSCDTKPPALHAGIIPTQTPLVPLDILGFHREVMQNDGRRNNRAVWGWPSFLARAIWLTHWTVNKPQGRKHSEEMSVVIHHSGLRMLSMGLCWEMLPHVTSSCGQKLQWCRNPGGSWEAPLGWGGRRMGLSNTAKEHTWHGSAGRWGCGR